MWNSLRCACSADHNSISVFSYFQGLPPAFSLQRSFGYFQTVTRHPKKVYIHLLSSFTFSNILHYLLSFVQLQGGRVSAVYRAGKIQLSPKRSSFLSVPKQEVWVDSGSQMEAVPVPVEIGVSFGWALHRLTHFPCRSSQLDYSVSPANFSETIPIRKFL